jgi:ABC-type Fe3+/spermidine/putrescine transport system ATPase subunit
MPYFEARNLYKVWDTVTVDFSFTADYGTMTTIVGPSGSGKSTVLRLIAGLDTNDSRTQNNSSQVILDGADITSLAPGKRNTGMVMQSGALFLHLTVQDNVAYGLECRGVSKTEARTKAVEFLEQYNLGGFAKRYPDTLSGGEAQRVALARTLIIQPKLVLFDEPLSALDAPLRRKLAEDIRVLQKKNHFTGIMVTHDISEAKVMSDKIIVMKSGQKKWEGIPSDFNESYL